MKKRKYILVIILIIIYLVVFVSEIDIDEMKSKVSDTDLTNTYTYSGEDGDLEIETLEVEPCDLSGERKPNVKVDIGYDSDYANREYYAYTNDLSQLSYVHADELILQNDDIENNGSDRYCSDEAKVPGVEAVDLDEGHVIADSLGGVSNAYNITPQNRDVNRFGEQTNFEEEIRSALLNGEKVTDFNAFMYYGDETMIPVSYHVEYNVDESPRVYDFNNE